jgi:hypothetical protein
MSERALTWIKEERASLQRRLDAMLSGQLRTGQKRQQGGTWVDVDTTAESIMRRRETIDEFDAILAKTPTRQV